VTGNKYTVPGILVNSAVEDEIDVEEEAGGDDSGAHVEFEIATYPSDLTLSVIHEMFKEKDITIPAFQRNFVWNIRQSSLLIESFLLGLPVPQVFFYIDDENKNLVIDGQQRIMSVIFFFEGYFGVENMQGRRTVFRLSGLPQESPYAGKRFEDLSANDQRRLRNAVLRAVNIRQLAPTNQSTSMFHIFERLNTGGTPLRPQEIRNCVFHGSLVGALNEVNEHKGWRDILGRKVLDKHQRDVEMILRIFAMADRGEKYEKPMKEFLNQQMNLHKQDKVGKAQAFFEQFRKTCDIVNAKLPAKPFHLRGPLNLAAMDSIMATLIRNSERLPADLAGRYQALIEDEGYQQSIYFNTSDTSVVKERLKLAAQHLIR
jgi:hypothetical protein